MDVHLTSTSFQVLEREPRCASYLHYLTGTDVVQLTSLFRAPVLVLQPSGSWKCCLKRPVFQAVDLPVKTPFSPKRVPSPVLKEVHLHVKQSLQATAYETTMRGEEDSLPNAPPPGLPRASRPPAGRPAPLSTRERHPPPSRLAAHPTAAPRAATSAGGGGSGGAGPGRS